MPETDDPTLGYREAEHAGFSWKANEEGLRFLVEVGDWSPHVLAARDGWKVQNKPHHQVYWGLDRNGLRYLIKFYPTAGARRYFWTRRVNRAIDEFSKALLANSRGIPTVLPLAVGEGKKDLSCGLIIYPFLDRAVTLERIYDPQNPNRPGIKERHRLERRVGDLMRKLVERGAYPVDAHLDHFLVVQSVGESMSVYYIDLERIAFDSLSRRLWKRSRLIKTLGRLIARLEWYRISGGHINRPSMMRIAHAYLDGFFFSVSLDRSLSRAVVQAAERYWFRRRFNSRGRYPLRSVEPAE